MEQSKDFVNKVILDLSSSQEDIKLSSIQNLNKILPYIEKERIKNERNTKHKRRSRTITERY